VYSISGPIVGHVGDGNFHSLILVDPDNESEIATAKQLANKMAESVLVLTSVRKNSGGCGNPLLVLKVHSS